MTVCAQNATMRHCQSTSDGSYRLVKPFAAHKNRSISRFKRFAGFQEMVYPIDVVNIDRAEIK